MFKSLQESGEFGRMRSLGIIFCREEVKQSTIIIYVLYAYFQNVCCVVGLFKIEWLDMQ